MADGEENEKLLSERHKPAAVSRLRESLRILPVEAKLPIRGWRLVWYNLAAIDSLRVTSDGNEGGRTAWRSS